MRDRARHRLDRLDLLDLLGLVLRIIGQRLFRDVHRAAREQRATRCGGRQFGKS
jgi:hypothetical protein